MCIHGEDLLLSQRQSTPSAAWRRPRRGWEEPNSRTQKPKARIHGTSDDVKADPSVRREQEDRDEALEIYLLERVPGLREHYAAQHSAFSQLEDDAYARHPDPTPDDIAAAEAAEAALPSRKRTEAQLRRSFAPLAVHLPSEIKRKRKRFVQQGQRAWNRANPTPLTWELERTLAAEFIKTFGH